MKLAKTTLAAAAIASIAACTTKTEDNPLLTDYGTPFNIPPFEKIEYRHYMPAIERGIEEHNAEIATIVADTAAPTWENTILALDNAGLTLSRVALVMYNLSSSDNTEEMQAITEQAMPLLSAHDDEVGMNPALFARIRQVYDNREALNLDTAQMRLLEKTYRGFVRSGALLSPADQETLKQVNTDLTKVTLNFSNTLLAAVKDAEVVVDSREELAGLDETTISGAAEEAKARGKEGKYVLTLDYAVRQNVLTNCDNRDVRRRMYETYIALATDSAHNNLTRIDTIVHLRQRKAELLGFRNYAAFKCDNVMSKTPEAAIELLMKLWEPAVRKVREEVADMQAYANSHRAEGEDLGLIIEPWDYQYFAEKVKGERYALTESDTQPYFELGNVIEKGIFNMAQRLYGVTFSEIKDAPKYDADLRVYEVKDADGSHLAVYMLDPYKRPTKVQGAWMTEFQSACDYDGIVERPIVINVMNYTKPSAGKPCLLTLDEVQTLFHEFGHGLQGMLTKAKYRSQAGTGVDRDCVELPSQINEKWATEPELLAEYALHYETGEPMPQALIDKLQASAKHNQGFMTCELAGAALLDLMWHTAPITDERIDAQDFEHRVAEQLGVPREMQFRYRSSYFKHIFSDEGYAAGYYTYLWADVLVSDAYDLFRQNGAFDPATATLFRQCILEPGDSRDAMELFVRFRGHKPSPEALLRDRGLN
ncbi:MAG: M3 family metallopeptidase [Bacteroidaceae bacterium]|nr:M3 family metallopeptidase [Bacteroidaceae bacterium]